MVAVSGGKYRGAGRLWRRLCLGLTPALACVAALAIPLPAAAEPVLPGWAAAQISGSERLALYALNRARPDGSAGTLAALAQRQGVGHRGPPRLLSFGPSAWPVLRYDANFNGGIPGREMVIGGLPFTVAARDRAMSGIVLGAGARIGGRLAYADGSTLDFGAEVQAEALVGKGAHRQSAGVNLCAQQRLAGFSWFDLCLGQLHQDRSYDSDRRIRYLSAGPTVLLTAGGIDQQVGLRLSRNLTDDFAQTGAGLDWFGAVPNLGAVQIGMDAARLVPGENTRLRGIDMALTRPLAGRVVRVGLGASETGGSTVFGAPRRDRRLTASLAGPLTPTLATEMRLTRTNSTISVYDDTEFGISFSLIGPR